MSGCTQKSAFSPELSDEEEGRVLGLPEEITVWRSWDFGCGGEKGFGKCFIPAGAAENQGDQSGAIPEPSLVLLSWVAQVMDSRPTGKILCGPVPGDDDSSSSFSWTEGESCEGPSPAKQPPE